MSTGQVWVRLSLLELAFPLTASHLRMGDEMSVLLTKEKGVSTTASTWEAPPPSVDPIGVFLKPW